MSIRQVVYAVLFPLLGIGLLAEAVRHDEYDRLRRVALVCFALAFGCLFLVVTVGDMAFDPWGAAGVGFIILGLLAVGVWKFDSWARRSGY